jgi:hypothetical protein
MPARDGRYEQIGVNSGGDAVYGLRGAHPVGTTAVAEQAVEYEDMTKAELEELLVARDLPKTGNKDELVARLQEDDG